MYPVYCILYPVSSLIFDLYIYLQDSPDTPHGELRYEIDSVAPASGTSHFLLDLISGELRLAIAFDFEDGVNSYDLELSAWDNLG